MSFQIVRNDITRVTADAIVNTANPLPIYANGTDRAIYKAAGAGALLAERVKIGSIARGEIAVTPAFALPAKYVIHAVGPVWEGGDHDEAKILTSCYRLALLKAVELGCESIAFPLIASGVYGFPKDLALRIAIDTISDFLMTQDMRVLLVVFDQRAFELSGKVFEDIEELISEAEVREKRAREYVALHGTAEQRWGSPRGGGRERRRRPDAAVMADVLSVYEKETATNETIPEDGVCVGLPKAEPQPPAPTALGTPMTERELEALLKEKREGTFQRCLFGFIDASGMKDSEVYRAAQIDRKLFSKIRKPSHNPSKETCVALAIGLKLNLEQTKELLASGGYTLSPENKFDIIISYFIQNRIYKVCDINLMLYKYGQKQIGNSIR